MIDKELFCRIVSDMSEYEQHWENLNAFFSSNKIDGYIHPNTTPIDDLIILLKKMFDDPNDLIEWFCITRHYGTTADDSGSLKRIKTAGELYDCLTKGKE